MKLLIISLILLVLSGCATRKYTEYYENGAIKSEVVDERFFLSKEDVESKEDMENFAEVIQKARGVK